MKQFTPEPTIDFPPWVKITACEVRRESRFFSSRHGRVRFETYTLTPHGQAMDSWRRRKALAEGPAVTFFHRRSRERVS